MLRAKAANEDTEFMSSLIFLGIWGVDDMKRNLHSKITDMLHMLGLPKFGFDLSRAKSLKLTISREKYEHERGV